MAEETTTHENDSSLQDRPARKGGGVRSLFWSFLLIGVGALWLLVNLNVLDEQHLSVLLRVWPIIVIAIGLEIVLGRNSRVLGALIGIGTLATLLTLIIVGPSIGLSGDEDSRIFGIAIGGNSNLELKQDRFVTRLDNAESAHVTLDLSLGETQVHSQLGPDNLIDADLTYLGEIEFEVSGGDRKTVRLSESGDFPRISFLDTDLSDLQWNIGLSPELPMDLAIDGGAGPVTLDLDELQLTSVDVDGGVGPLDIALAATGERYPAHLNLGAGPVTLEIDDNAALEIDYDGGVGPITVTTGDNVDLQIEGDNGAGPVTFVFGRDANGELKLNSGVGPVTVDLLPGEAVRLEVRDSGPGAVVVRSDMQLVDNFDDGLAGTGIWQTDGFDGALHKIDIIITQSGAGPVTVK